MPFTVGAEESELGRTTDLRGDDQLLDRRQEHRPVPPLHAVEVPDLDTVPDSATAVGVAVCGVEVLLFRWNWPNAALAGDRCQKCDLMTR